MRFDKIVLSGWANMVLFDMNDPTSSPFITRTVDGLGPTEVDLALSQSVHGSGIFVGGRAQLREITFNLTLKPRFELGETLASVRDQVYSHYLRSVRADDSLDLVLLRNDSEVARTTVYVKKIESNPFAKESLMQLVLSSTEQYFYRSEPYSLDSETLKDVSKERPSFYNIGSAPTGFQLLVNMLATGTSFGLSRIAPREHLKVEYDFNGGDVLEIDTRVGRRGVWLYRGAGRRQILSAMTLDSTWLTLPTGNSQLHVMENSVPSFDWSFFSYHPLYLGV